MTLVAVAVLRAMTMAVVDFPFEQVFLKQHSYHSMSILVKVFFKEKKKRQFHPNYRTNHRNIGNAFEYKSFLFFSRFK